MNKFLICAAGFILGLAAMDGVKNAQFNKGRLSGCRDVMSTVSFLVPPLSALECTTYKNGEVVLKVGDLYFSLDGKKLN